MANLNIGVVIGRFQVPTLHEGHQRLFSEVAAKSDQLVVLLGVSPMDGYTAENPLTFNQRQSIIRAELPATTSPVILPLADQRTNEDWSAQIDAVLKTAYPNDNITLYGGRDSFTECYRGKLKVERVVFTPPVPVAGTVNRAAIKESNSPDFYAGQIYALQRQFPHAYLTVDVALLRDSGKPNLDEVLLIQRADSGRWCFPGGFVDPTDQTIEYAAARELHEEVGLIAASGSKEMHYLGSFLIDDFRYRGSRDKIMTTFFSCRHSFGAPTLNYNEVQDFKWCEVISEAPKYISDTHRPLLEALQLRYYLPGMFHDPVAPVPISLTAPEPWWVAYRDKKMPGCTINHTGPCNVACTYP